MTEEPEVVDLPLDVGEVVHFYPSKPMQEKYKVPEARYGAICIGSQQNKQPILRILNPVPLQTTSKAFNLPKLELRHKSGFVLAVGGKGNATVIGRDTKSDALFVGTQDFTIWCDEESTWGTWERRNAQ